MGLWYLEVFIGMERSEEEMVYGMMSVVDGDRMFKMRMLNIACESI